MTCWVWVPIQDKLSSLLTAPRDAAVARILESMGIKPEMTCRLPLQLPEQESMRSTPESMYRQRLHCSTEWDCHVAGGP
ncbi:hypothetical protein AK812_SmicGene38476 [Symbiodinium microadriaticum]|uniref:Uncharacterized protein n=1 Tax=Symbiodinium microadriaticum TaxID=2951 RepID=A0A1Q9CDL4_SYMMI|nr:hypothetical protein AK812_SmicGene38476 [Symbiodinium microadriaticum]